MLQIGQQNRVIDISFGGHGDSRLKSTWWYLYGLNKDVKKKKDTFCTAGGRAILIATGSNLLDTKYEFYRFNDYVRETI